MFRVRAGAKARTSFKDLLCLALGLGLGLNLGLVLVLVFG